jgi:hypothetical protein
MLATTFSGVYLASKLFRQTGAPGYAFICGLLIFGLIDGFTESGMVSPLFATFLSAGGVMTVVWHGGKPLASPQIAPMAFEPAGLDCVTAQ